MERRDITLIILLISSVVFNISWYVYLLGIPVTIAKKYLKSYFMERAGMNWRD